MVINFWSDLTWPNGALGQDHYAWKSANITEQRPIVGRCRGIETLRKAITL